MTEPKIPWLSFKRKVGVQKVIVSYRWPTEFKKALAAQAEEETRKWGQEVTATDILYTQAKKHRALAQKEKQFAKKEKHHAQHQSNKQESQPSNS